jgi:hypothetical protein
MRSDKYYLSLKASISRTHLIHRADCPFLPGRGQRIFLGVYHDTEDPETTGRIFVKNPHRCRFCCRMSNKNQSAGAMPRLLTVPEETWDSALTSAVN